MIMTPKKVIDELPITRVSAHGLEGSFVILENHIDLLSVLKRCIVMAEDESGNPSVYAVDGGVLTKQGKQVRISSPLVIKGSQSASEDPEAGLSSIIEKTIQQLKEQSSRIQTETTRIESSLIHRMIRIRGEL